MRKIPKWLIRRYFEFYSGGSVYEYRCKLCGEIVEKGERSKHIRFKHPLEWARLEKEKQKWEKPHL